VAERCSNRVTVEKSRLRSECLDEAVALEIAGMNYHSGMRQASVLFLIAFLTLVVGCTDCQNEAQAEHASPDGQWKYVSLDRNCGATTGSNLQISVLPVSKAPSSGAANAFIADDNHGATRFVAQPEWMFARKLRIVYSSKARIFKRESKVGLIDIEYVQEP